MPEITADAGQLTQVVVNLVVNSIQAMPEGGKLNVRTDVQDQYVVCIVEDTGVGMTEDVLDRLFVPFFTTKEVNQGTGLGLPVVHGIVTSHGGTIEVKSKPGKGTKFTIRLPIEPGTIQENREES
jgi:signal transduction histidine kinase